MDGRSTFRTLVRVFLVIGGITFVALGVQDGSAFDIGIGVVAIVLGAGGLYYQYYWQSAEVEDPEPE